jgi:hypothetical protein
MCELDDKNRIEQQFMSSQAFHRTTGGRVQEITVGEQFEPRIIESFDPVTQELYRLLPTTIHTKIHAKIEAFEERLGSQSTASNRAQRPLGAHKIGTTTLSSENKRNARKL